MQAGEHTKLRRDSILGISSGEMRQVPGFRQDNLKAVCITGFCSAKSLVELTSQILQNTPSLQDLVLDTTHGFHNEFVELGKCHIMCNEALTEANNAVEALRMYVEGKVPSSVRLKVWEPCKRCHAGKSRRTWALLCLPKEAKKTRTLYVFFSLFWNKKNKSLFCVFENLFILF